jgi:hypothetical protein
MLSHITRSHFVSIVRVKCVYGIFLMQNQVSCRIFSKYTMTWSCKCKAILPRNPYRKMSGRSAILHSCAIISPSFYCCKKYHVDNLLTASLQTRPVKYWKRLILSL